MITKLTTEEELYDIFIETFFNKQSKVTKVSPHSIVAGVGFGNAKTAQKAIKDVAVNESNMFPDSAYGSKLDSLASNFGIPSRFGASKGSTFLRIVANVGTTYSAGVNSFTGNHGVVFDLVSNFTMTNPGGYDYVEVVSREKGSFVNVEPLTINKVSPTPSGHKYVVNEYKVTGGRDSEQDDYFRQRIKDTPNINAMKTISFFEQLFMLINSDVLRVFNLGTSKGKTVLGVVTQNGRTLTNQELSDLYGGSKDYLAITDLKPFGETYYGVEIINASFYPVDIDFRVKLTSNTNSDDYRLKVQVALQKKYSYKTWKDGDTVQWGDAYSIAKSITGADYVPRQFFLLNNNTVDLPVSDTSFPRLRSFTMRNENGNIIANQTGTLQPYYYPSDKNVAITTSIL